MSDKRTVARSISVAATPELAFRGALPLSLEEIGKHPGRGGWGVW
jgi:hypothetical protein